MKNLFIVLCIVCLPTMIALADVVVPAHFHTVSASGDVGTSTCDIGTEMAAGETCVLHVDGVEDSPPLLLKRRKNCTVRQTHANIMEIVVGQGGDYFTPAGFTFTAADDSGNLGETEGNWESIIISTTTFNEEGDVYVTCK